MNSGDAFHIRPPSMLSEQNEMILFELPTNCATLVWHTERVVDYVSWSFESAIYSIKRSDSLGVGMPVHRIMLRVGIYLVTRKGSSVLFRRNGRARMSCLRIQYSPLLDVLTLDTGTLGERSTTTCWGRCDGVYGYQEFDYALGVASYCYAFSN